MRLSPFYLHINNNQNKKRRKFVHKKLNFQIKGGFICIFDLHIQCDPEILTDY